MRRLCSALGACSVVFVDDNRGVTAEYIISRPATPEEFEAYFLLRWQVLRAYHDMPRGSERDEFDELEADVDHVTVSDGAGELLGVGRLHLISADEAQIRYMAVREGCRAQGIGRALVTELERRAADRAVRRVVLNARETVVGFYEQFGYRVVSDGPTMFEVVKHKRMEKVL